MNYTYSRLPNATFTSGSITFSTSTSADNRWPTVKPWNPLIKNVVFEKVSSELNTEDNKEEWVALLEE